MEGITSTSVVSQGVKSVESDPLSSFCEDDEIGCLLELYPRADGSVYVCGCGGSNSVSCDRLCDGGDRSRAVVV